MRLARRLDFGAVWINTHIPFASEMPHGGFKHSGYGKDLSDVRVRGLHPDQARDELSRASEHFRLLAVTESVPGRLLGDWFG